jgi:hypothetical protein
LREVEDNYIFKWSVHQLSFVRRGHSRRSQAISVTATKDAKS